MTVHVSGEGQVDKLNPVLLSKTEIQWLLGKAKVSKLFEYQLKSRIKKKVQSLIELELPLLVKTNFIDCYDDSQRGRDLESGPLLTKSQDVKTQALVRQRSRVQIPAKANLFLEKEKEMSPDRYLPIDKMQLTPFY
jgi:hypothetical protein